MRRQRHIAAVVLFCACYCAAVPLWAQEPGVAYPVAGSDKPPSATEGLAAELGRIEEVIVAGDYLEYDEAAGTAQWTGNVELIAGELRLTTEQLLLTFALNDEGTPELQTLSATPQVDLTVRKNLVLVHGEAMQYSFPEESGRITNATVEVVVPANVVTEFDRFPLGAGELRTTIVGETVEIQGSEVTVHGADVALITQGGSSLRLTATRMVLFNPAPGLTRLRTRNLRIEVNGHQVIKLPWEQTFKIQGESTSGGFDIDFPHPVSAEEGLGLYTDVLYGFGDEGDNLSVPWIVGTHFETVFADRTYIEHYLDYFDDTTGQVRLSYGTVRGVSPIDQRSLPVVHAPEVWWYGTPVELGDWLSFRPEIGVGHIQEKSTGRESDRVRTTLHYHVAPIQPWEDVDLYLYVKGKLDQRYYDDGKEQRIGEIGMVLRYFETGKYGAEVGYFRRDDTGFSPFLHDRLELREEVSFRYRVLGKDGWGAVSRGRFNVEEDRWRNYSVGVSKRFELLEATLMWDTVSDALVVEFGLPGSI